MFVLAWCLYSPTPWYFVVVPNSICYLWHMPQKPEWISLLCFLLNCCRLGTIKPIMSGCFVLNFSIRWLSFFIHFRNGKLLLYVNFKKCVFKADNIRYCSEKADNTITLGMAIDDFLSIHFRNGGNCYSMLTRRQLVPSHLWLHNIPFRKRKHNILAHVVSFGRIEEVEESAAAKRSTPDSMEVHLFG